MVVVVVLINSYHDHYLLLRPNRGMEHFDERVCQSVCVFVCLRSSPWNYTSDLHQFFVHVTYGWGSVIL